MKWKLLDQDGPEEFDVYLESLELGDISPNSSSPKNQKPSLLQQRRFRILTDLRCFLRHQKKRIIVLCIAIGLFSLAVGFLCILEALEVRSCVTIPEPPIAKKVPVEIMVDGQVFVDNYAWMKDINTDPDVLLYIEAENQYTETYMKVTNAAQSKLTQELRDLEGNTFVMTWPFETFWMTDRFFYFVNTTQAFPIYARWKRLSSHTNQAGMKQELALVDSQFSNVIIETMVDVNIVAQQFIYTEIGSFEVSPSEELVAFSIDHQGNEEFTLYAKNLTSGTLLFQGNGIPAVYYSVTWAGNRWLFFNRLEMQIPRQIWRVCIDGCNVSPNAIEGNPFPLLEQVYREDDNTLTVNVEMTYDQAFVTILVIFAGRFHEREQIFKVLGQRQSEVQIAPASVLSLNDLLVFEAVFARSPGIQYSLTHRNGLFLVRHNYQAPNFRVFSIPVGTGLSIGSVSVQEIIPTSPSVFIERIEVFHGFLITWVWHGGLKRFRVTQFVDSPTNSTASPLVLDIGTEISFGDVSSPYLLMPGTIEDMESRLRRSYNSSHILFSNASYLQPFSTFEIHLPSLSIRSINVPTKLNISSNLIETRLLLSTYDHKFLPVSLFYSTTAFASNPQSRGCRPMIVNGYGAYGTFMEPMFDASLLALVNRGFVWVQVHPRGDGDLGWWWYADGSTVAKMNTFLDVHTAIQELVSSGLTGVGCVALRGRSAGGLVAGTALNWWGVEGADESEGVPKLDGEYDPTMLDGLRMALDRANPANKLVSVVVADVPFFDVITDLMDPSMPWTTFEWSEWGNPNNHTEFLFQKDYSPYDRVSLQDYPATLITGGLSDSRVQVSDPIKMVAKLREFKLNDAEGRRCLDFEDSKVDGRPLLLKVQKFGHFGGDDVLAQKAFWMIFIADQLGFLDAFV